MEIIDIVLYFILILILIALIAVLSWLIYDFYDYKEKQKTLNSSMNSKINENSSSDNNIKNEISALYLNNSNYMNSTSNLLINYTKNTNSKFDYNKIYIDDKITRTSNYIDLSVKLLSSNIDTSNINYNKILNNTKQEFNSSNINTKAILDNYFMFSEVTPETGIFNRLVNTISGNANTAGPVQNPYLNLIKETTAIAGLRVNTFDAEQKYLKVCNNATTTCYNLFVDTDNSLVAQFGNDITTKQKLALNEFVPAAATATLTGGIVSAINVTAVGKGYVRVPDILIGSGLTTPTTNAIARANLNVTGGIASISVITGGAGYGAVAPTITIVK